MSVLMEIGNDHEKVQYVETVAQVLDLWKERLIQAFEQEGLSFRGHRLSDQALGLGSPQSDL